MLFWWNGSAHIRDGKKATKLAQIAVSPIQRREHEGKWTRFHLLPDLCPLCRSRCHEKSLTSVWSPLPTQLQSVSESVGSRLPTQFEWVNVCTWTDILCFYIYAGSHKFTLFCSFFSCLYIYIYACVCFILFFSLSLFLSVYTSLACYSIHSHFICFEYVWICLFLLYFLVIVHMYYQ